MISGQAETIWSQDHHNDNIVALPFVTIGTSLYLSFSIYHMEMGLVSIL